MEYIRWYDEDTYLAPIMRILEQLPPELQDSVAQDLVQIVMGYQNNLNDNKINYLNENLLSNYRRWYDINPNLHSSIELLKTANPQTKKEICDSVMEFLFQLMIQENLINND